MKRKEIKGPKLNIPNQNGRIYPENDFKRALEDYRKLIDKGQAYGIIGHHDEPIFPHHLASHVVTDVKIRRNRCPRKLKKKLKKTNKWAMWKYKNLRTYLDMEILTSPQGKILEGIMDSTFISMNSLGNVDKNNKVTNLKIVSFDLMPKPSN